MFPRTARMSSGAECLRPAIRTTRSLFPWTERRTSTTRPKANNRLQGNGARSQAAPGTAVPVFLNPRTFNLSQGQHTLVFRGREAFSMIDRILLCNDPAYVPGEVVAANDSVIAMPNTATQINPATLLATNDSSLFASPLKATAVSPGRQRRCLDDQRRDPLYSQDRIPRPGRL